MTSKKRSAVEIPASANVDYQAHFWQMASADYKHVCLGIVDSQVTVLGAASGVDSWLLSVGFTRRGNMIEALGNGSIGPAEFSRIKPGHLPCIVSSERLQARLGVAAERQLGRLSNSQGESASLAMLRDALLPKRVSGELRIRTLLRQATTRIQ